MSSTPPSSFPRWTYPWDHRVPSWLKTTPPYITTHTIADRIYVPPSGRNTFCQNAGSIIQRSYEMMTMIVFLVTALRNSYKLIVLLKSQNEALKELLNARQTSYPPSFDDSIPDGQQEIHNINQDIHETYRDSVIEHASCIDTFDPDLHRCNFHFHNYFVVRGQMEKGILRHIPPLPLFDEIWHASLEWVESLDGDDNVPYSFGLIKFQGGTRIRLDTSQPITEVKLQLTESTPTDEPDWSLVWQLVNHQRPLVDDIPIEDFELSHEEELRKVQIEYYNTA
ncbi:hypothetical protein GX51_08329 [Blastomyces parvus]|uniref:Uncharacterized protein n=1 Tax=Blastomyces parvus TaxID=2060905 RepID=A0A2B7WEL5_9EURO|nr:hypothetical protein GX51_08329 [Blastomyces parvus]